MPEQLGIKIVHLERRVMHMRRRGRAHKEGMMIDKLLAAINMRKEPHVPHAPGRALIRHAQEIRRHEVEITGIELDLGRQVRDAEAVVAELVDGGGPSLEALEGALARFLLLEVVDEFLGELAGLGGYLAEDQIDGEAFGVEEGEAVAAAGGGG